jgi:hypothetical protein
MIFGPGAFGSGPFFDRAKNMALGQKKNHARGAIKMVKVPQLFKSFQILLNKKSSAH